MLEMFLDENLVEVIAIVDPNSEAPGIKTAKEHGVPTFSDAVEALHACKDHPTCIIYNLTHDDSIAEAATRILGSANITSGFEAKLFWQIVTNAQHLKNEFQKSQKQLQAIIHNVMDGIITINKAGEIQGFNPAAEQIFGYLQHELLGKNLNILMPEPVKSEHDSYISRYHQTGRGKIIGVRGREVTAVRKNGEEFPMELNASEMTLGGQLYFVGVVRDITERKLAEQKIEHLAHHDYLTGLPNRALFMDRLQQSIALAERRQYKEAVLFLDLDGFKGINDSLGHDVGDLLLKEVATRLNKCIRTSDSVARIGGDEFTIILNNIALAEEASIIANKIIADLSEPFTLNDQPCKIGCSIGIAIFPDDGLNTAALLKMADEAMYLSKQRGKNTFTFYTSKT